MQKKARILTAVLVSLAILILIPVSFAFTLQWIAGRSMQRFKKPVTDPPPDMFPLLVLTPSATDPVPDPHIVYYKDLQSFLEKNPRATFTIPDGSEEKLNSKLDRRSQSQSGDQSSAGWWFARFKVQRLASGRQRFEVEGTWDDDRQNIGWYEAGPKDFVPQFYQVFFGPGVAMSAALPAAAITGVFWLLILIGAAVWLTRRARRKAVIWSRG